jgi:hypothetical protein
MSRIVRGFRSALALLAVGLCAGLNAAEPTDPRIGAWQETRSSGEFQSVLRVFEDLGDGLQRMTLNAKLDEPNRWHVDFRCDGRSYRAVTRDGRYTGTRMSCRRSASRSYEMSFVYESPEPGVVIAGLSKERRSAVSIESVSADGERYTTDITTTFIDGETRTVRREFIRRK